jgi:hypothetical protein
MVGASSGVFQRLPDLGSDDAVVVKRADGTEATFKRTDSNSVAAGERPIRLQLVGCGDQSPVIVYTELIL